MSWIAKIAIIVFCFSICGAASFITLNVREKSEPQKANAIPVKNHEVARRFWIEI
jgi:hypothetical protein